MSSIKVSPDEWMKINKKIGEDYGKTTMLIRSVCKRTLGFTARYHHSTVKVDYADYPIQQLTIYLDFDDETALIMFRLKYL